MRRKEKNEFLPAQQLRLMKEGFFQKRRNQKKNSYEKNQKQMNRFAVISQLFKRSQ